MKLETELPVPDRDARQVIEKNFRAIVDEDSKDDYDVQKIKKRVENLETSRATHDEVQDVKNEWKKKIEHVALGTDYETVEKAVTQILKEKGLV